MTSVEKKDQLGSDLPTHNTRIMSKSGERKDQPDSTKEDSPAHNAHSMSKIEERKDQPHIIKENPPALNTCSRTSDKPSEEGMTKKKERKGILEKFKAIFTGPSIMVPDSTSRFDSQFSPNDRVVVLTVGDKPIYGTVGWVGPVKPSKENGGIVIPVVGIETVS